MLPELGLGKVLVVSGAQRLLSWAPAKAGTTPEGAEGTTPMQGARG